MPDLSAKLSGDIVVTWDGQAYTVRSPGAEGAAMASDRLWKVTGPNGEAIHGGAFTYDLPKLVRGRWVPGAWTPRIPKAELVACERAYHGCRDRDLVHWCNGERIWLMEFKDDAYTVHQDNDKVFGAQCRLVAPTPWDATTARLFAVECASDVLPLMTDDRSRAALEVAYRHALGDATDAELAAALAAARAAARDAALDAALDAACAAAWDAAWAAASAAASAAACAAA